MKHYLRLMRIHHYIKNLLVFTALVCSGKLFKPEKLIAGILGFASFCMISSVVYIVNDIKDQEKDSLHPTKCKRPIAAGKISVNQAQILAALLFLLSLLCNSLVFHFSSTLLLLLYLILNLAYSFGLKNIPILDVTILVSGFMIRILYGAIVTEIEISNWLYLTVIVFAFYLAFGKRRNEMMRIEDEGQRKVLKSYSIGFLDKNMTICLTLANAFYALWCMDAKTMAFYNTEHLILTFPIVLLITMKYSLDIERDSDGDPVNVLLHDKVLCILCMVYLGGMFAVLYL